MDQQRRNAATGRTPSLRAHAGDCRAAAVAAHPRLSDGQLDWVRVWPRLAASHSLYALDLLGFGRSAKPRDSGYPTTLQADLCMALLDDWGVRNAHVLAHDYGDTVAQELLAREQEGRLHIASVAFLNGGLFPEAHRARPIQKLLARPLEYEDGRQALARLINYMEQRRRYRARWVGALVVSHVPRRLICGAMDPVSGRQLADRYRELVPDPDVVPEDVGHYPHLEVHDRVVDEYEVFFRRVAGGLSRTRTP